MVFTKIEDQSYYENLNVDYHETKDVSHGRVVYRRH